MARGIRIVNMVVSTDFKHPLNLEKIASTLPNTEYNPEQFPGLVIRLKTPKSSALLFTTGRVVCTGAKTMKEVKESIHKIMKLLEKVKVKITIEPEIHVQNMVASGALGFALNLNDLVMKLKNVEYEPEQFPGLVYKIKEPKSSFLLFSNGKIVCTGVKSKKEADEAVAKLEATLEKVKKK
ncbi:TATA-box-binding protein [Candidatus Woesearchaeota archaeon CG_4_10_14_0_2_um_filter_33_10]|nr:MAG: TATA-box-binding protein [Candidatus Woesearchaeota archaeon CG10_big_fil_rev_8_21_14_0_10_33_12]PIU72499.1 MAG: TATA-box-binding protein [Candidatus Woesearchaeota archaeon CG06_land_8_20_14_3_00_33_13]PIZ51954.1 MAG: TATA-box-binding protein [Candidatus Woesearchaeota archaeon CG_4_10_14_0_2_um_filter_33_10]